MNRRLPLLLILLAFALPLLAATFRLYLKDGTWQPVREYETQQDRVRYYSTERSDWEELPLNLVDLARTEAERKQAVEEIKQTAAVEDAEDKYDREQARLAASIPPAPGAYYATGDKVATLKQAESKIVTDKKRAVLKVLAPIPLIVGKATIEVDGARSGFVIVEERPVLWFRMSAYERFGIVRCDPKKESRVVETWYTAPASNELVTARTTIEIFSQQVGEDLYRIWPQKPLAAGEYAVVEYAEGERNTQVWDFRVEPKSEK